MNETPADADRRKACGGRATSPIQTIQARSKRQARTGPISGVASWTADIQGRRKAAVLQRAWITTSTTRSGATPASLLVRETQEAMSAAQRASVNIYPIDPRGVELIQRARRHQRAIRLPAARCGNFRGALRELLLSYGESLIALANETGGIAVVNAGDVVGGLGPRGPGQRPLPTRLLQRREALVRQVPAIRCAGQASWPARARAQRDFMPPNSRAIAKARDAETKAGTSPALRAALAQAGGRRSAVPRLRRAAQGTRRARLGHHVIEIDGGSLKFRERSGRLNETVEVSIVAADERAKVQGTDRQSFG